MLVITACGEKDPKEMIVGKWECSRDAYGRKWHDPMILRFDDDESGSLKIPEDNGRFESHKFNYTVKEKTISFDWEDTREEKLKYKFSDDGNTLTIYGIDDDDMDELEFSRIREE